MIYFDNSATSLQKPPSVAAAVQRAIGTLGNAGRSFYDAAMDASRTVHAARSAVAKLSGISAPQRVAFTSGVTESLNLVAAGLLRETDAVITTVLEHNSVLRPLYNTGCEVSVVNCDDEGNLLWEELPQLLRPNTKAVFCTHASNLLGTLVDLSIPRAFCRQHGLLLVVDVAQTFGQMPLHADDADIVCFTGHKALLGPQGTGGLIAQPGLPLRIVKTGGSGSDSFAKLQPHTLPGMFEAGTANSHGLAGLTAGVEHLLMVGVETVQQREAALTHRFLEGIAGIPGLTLYGPHRGSLRGPVVALNVQGTGAEDVALRLWEEFGIATRPGSHCAPLAHERFGTTYTGMVRFSFGHYTTTEEIDAGVAALAHIAASAR